MNAGHHAQVNSSTTIYRNKYKHLLQIGAILAALSPITSFAQNILHVDSQGNFADNTGAKVILRGLNMSQHHKMPPFRPNTDPALFAKLKGMGVNFIRLQFNWEAYEPAPGAYDQSYLDYYVQTLNRATQQQIHVLVDIHQDAVSRWSLSGCGEGFPLWVAQGMQSSISPPNNGAMCWMWPARAKLNERKLNNMFNLLYTDPTLRSHYFKMLENIAQRVNQNPYVAGYDVLNEPWGDVTKLNQFYQDATLQIRSLHPDAIIFTEHMMLEGDGTSKISVTNPNISNMAFAAHYYEISTAYLGLVTAVNYAKVAVQRRDLSRAWGAAHVLGEFGSVPSLISMGYMDRIYADLDQNGESSAQWTWTPEWNVINKDGWNKEDLSVVDGRGNLRANFRIRPYIQRTAGVENSLKVQYPKPFVSPKLSATWNNNPQMGLTTIFVPNGFISPNKAKITTSTDVTCSWSAPQLLSCQSSSVGSKNVMLTSL